MLIGAMAGCRRAAPEPGHAPAGALAASDEVLSVAKPTPPGGLHISLIAPVFPPPAGDGRLVIRVADADDEPIDTAALRIRGDMVHEGMMPIEATAAAGEDGVYRAPIRWTMAGEWTVTVEVTVNDGRQATRTFDITVTGEEESCEDGL